MSKFETFLFDLLGLVLAVAVLALCAYGTGAFFGQAVGSGNDNALAMGLCFLIASGVGCGMVYCSAMTLCKPLNRDNMQHIAGLAVGVVNRYTGKRYTKDERGTRWFSTVAANICANGDAFEWFPYK